MNTIKVLVVEDEILLLNNIVKKICSASSDFSVAGTAFNGREALELVENLHPQVIFTDIRMPIMDGLELSRIVKETHPEIAVVIVSGFDDFEYARTALSLGVKDYLLKPLQTEQLSDLLADLRYKIRTQDNNRTYAYLNRQINGFSHSDQGLLPHSPQKSSLNVYLICLGNLQTRYHSAELDRYYQGLMESLDWIALMNSVSVDSESWWVFYLAAPNLRLLVLDSGAVPGKDFSQILLHRLKDIFAPVPVNMCASEGEVRAEHLYTTASQLRKTLYAGLCIGISRVFSQESVPIRAFPPAVLSLSEENHLNTLLHSGNQDGFRKSILQLLYKWETACYPQQWIEKVLHQIIMLLQQNYYFLEKDYEQVYSRVFGHLEKNFQISEGADSIADELLCWISLNKSVPSEIEDAIGQMDAYIRSHYTEPVNLSVLAEQYHFNPSYLTRLFKKVKGQTPQKLINVLRMNDAKKLLKNPDLSIREISEMLGYTDQHYFSRIFKESIGQTPKEFRK